MQFDGTLCNTRQFFIGAISARDGAISARDNLGDEQRCQAPEMEVIMCNYLASALPNQHPTAWSLTEPWVLISTVSKTNDLWGLALPQLSRRLPNPILRAPSARQAAPDRARYHSRSFATSLRRVLCHIVPQSTQRETDMATNDLTRSIEQSHAALGAILKADRCLR
jgi:hypothetical protein